jgi:hypothetical protein
MVDLRCSSHVQARPDPRIRRPALFAVGGLGAAACAIALAAASGAPYLSLDSLNPWLVVFAIGLFGALFATPFAIRATLGGDLEADARWERALLLWGAAALGALAIGLLCGLPSGFGSTSLAGSIGLVVVVEAVLVLSTLIAWLISG